MDNNLYSARKLKEQIQVFKCLTSFISQEQRDEANRIEAQLNHLFEIVDKYKKYFSDLGWCLYDSMNNSIMENAVIEYETNGETSAEEILLNYYKNDVRDIIRWIPNKAKPFMERYDLIQKAFDDHFNGRYYASVPLFLIIIDGAVNDFTHSRGFFAEGTDVTAWDCLVGCDDSLSKMQKIYTSTRTKTNNEEIRIPYRNGILHGRDLNYGNEYVSCKCVALMFALADWMKLKSSENERKEKFEKENNPSPISESLKKFWQIKEDQKVLSKWKRRNVIIGQDIPVCPSLEDCNKFPYIFPVVKTFSAWSKCNYKDLSNCLYDLFYYADSESKRAGECRSLFSAKKLISYEIKEIEERGCSLTRILVQATWENEDNTRTELLEFGSVYMAHNNEIPAPWRNNGEWTLKTWNVQGLYK